MADVLTKEQRRHNMSQIRSRDTKPEVLVRSILHRMGYRFRTHRKGLPGKPDVVLAKYRTVIFVHGCFWHRHSCKNGQSMPSTRPGFWKNKFDKNVERDARQIDSLLADGWSVLVVWECELAQREKLATRMDSFLKAAQQRSPTPIVDRGLAHATS